ncbi:hypothetical protein DF947_16025 [Pedobacter paludis]|uniref:DUF5648 domain-containing protein n=1 Tax=Pedobacter paludis TaxID=2203212 RepID=A0A317EZ66_9SPHI|nr:hypothetical protein [Pedobacter paludis]PWS31097.1 hypothetical protein DF947_16025 [Pedobacter paludis]
MPIYRYYNAGNGDHYYTLNQGNYSGYQYEGILGYAYSVSANNTNPVYSYYNRYNGDHYLSTSTTIPSNYIREGVAFYLVKK